MIKVILIMMIGTHSCDYHLRRTMIMVDYREILRLRSLGHNITQIAGSLHSSRNTVREVESGGRLERR